ncbi:MAG TPA: hydantoinase/oxoprolinase N-terminal domain-containing protein [Acetobacteraceae bacterium]|nr:hydantoinase/oxoprolinase N-terminal domain-containing protein [Acetobacteraceae bacterium]
MTPPPSAARLAVDIGGTFTDVALEHAGRRHTLKTLTTPAAPEDGVTQGGRRRASLSLDV